MKTEEMNRFIKSIKFGPPFDSWEPELKVEPQEHGFYLHVAINVPDSDTGQKSKFVHSFPYFYHPALEDFTRLVYHCLKQVILHELGESLWVGKDRPLYPHHT